jgi:coenzyme F420-reducing hydrogenase delta subunit
MITYEPKLVCFSCKFSWGYLADQLELARQIKNWIPIICTGKVDSTYVLDAFKQGADGVLVLGCPEGHCHYQDGNFEMKKRMYLLQKLLESYGIEKERLQVHLSLDPDGNTIPLIVRQMSESLKTLGPLRQAGVQGSNTEAVKN